MCVVATELLSLPLRSLGTSLFLGLHFTLNGVCELVLKAIMCQQRAYGFMIVAAVGALAAVRGGGRELVSWAEGRNPFLCLKRRKPVHLSICRCEQRCTADSWGRLAEI